MRNINAKEENILAVRCFVPYTQLFTYFDDVFLAYPLKTDNNISDAEFPTAFIMHEDNNKDKYIFLDANLFHKQEWRSELLPFVLLHELMHGKLKHITRFRSYFKRNRFLANVATDLFINTLIAGNFNLPSDFKSRIVLLDNYLSKQNTSVFGNKINPKWFEQITRDNIEQLTEDEIIEIMFNEVQDSMDSIDNIINQAIKEVLDEFTNKQQNSQNNSDNSYDNNSGDSSDNDSGNNSGNMPKDLKDLVDSAFNKVGEKFNKEFSSNSKFKEGIEKMSSFGNPEQSIKEEIIRRLLGDNGSQGEDTNEGKELNAKEGIKKIIEEISKKSSSKGITGSFFRNFTSDKKKFKKINVLQNYLTRLVKLGYVKYKTVYPNKIFSRSSLVMPDKKFVGGEFSFIVDTSGSMDDNDIKFVMSVTNWLVNNGFIVKMYFNDTEYQEALIDSPSKLKKIKNIKGGGGSVFTKVFKEVKKKAEFGIFYSDLYIDGIEHLPKSFLVIASGANAKEIGSLQSKGYTVFDVKELD
jgi:predicted metal-dependent peptidase